MKKLIKTGNTYNYYLVVKLQVYLGKSEEDNSILQSKIYTNEKDIYKVVDGHVINTERRILTHKSLYISETGVVATSCRKINSKTYLYSQIVKELKPKEDKDSTLTESSSQSMS